MAILAQATASSSMSSLLLSSPDKTIPMPAESPSSDIETEGALDQVESSPQSQIHLLGLPAELRLKIYAHLFRSSTISLLSWIPPGARSHSACLGIAAITAVCRRLREETLPVLRRESFFCMPEALKLLKRRPADAEGKGRGAGAFDGRTGVWNAAEMRSVEFEWQPFWGEDVSFDRVSNCFRGAEKIVVRCLICDRFVFHEEGKEQEVLSGVLGEEMTMGQAVRWVQEGLRTSRCLDLGRGVSVLVRMRLVATARNRWGGRAKWAEIGVSARPLLWF
jgi:hypothetical protein